MTHTILDTKTQSDIQIMGKIDDFFSEFFLLHLYTDVVFENVMGIVFAC